MIAREEARSIAEYDFLVVSGNEDSAFIKPSPLASFPVVSDVPGLWSFFQVHPDGSLTPTFVPPGDLDSNRYGVSKPELQERLLLQTEVARLLAGNNLRRQTAAPPVLDEGLDKGGTRAQTTAQTTASTGA